MISHLKISLVVLRLKGGVGGVLWSRQAIETTFTASAVCLHEGIRPESKEISQGQGHLHSKKALKEKFS